MERSISETPAQQEQQFELSARYHHLVGEDTQALTDLETLLTQLPSAVGALAFKGFLLEQQGHTGDALAAYDKAVDTFYAANPVSLQEPPDALILPQGRLRSKLLSQSGKRGQPQVSIQVIGQGKQAPDVFYLDLKISNVGNDVAENVLINRLAFETVNGKGQVFLNNVLSSLPIVTDFLGVNGTATVRIYVMAQGSVGSFSVTESGTTADIFGTPSSFTQTQTVAINMNPLPGDLNGDGSVGCDDLAIVKASFGKKAGQPGFDPRADVNGDGVVNILDLSTEARQLPPGTTCK